MSKSNPIANLQMVPKCPMCDFKYEKDDIKMVDKKDGLINLHLSCRRCKSSVVMIVITGALGVTSISMITDATERDLGRMKGNSVRYDDVLEMHRFFQSKDDEPPALEK
jgi:hypothetical protein